MPTWTTRPASLTGTLRERWSSTGPNPVAPRATHAWTRIGFGLENFDAIGAWRDKDGGRAIDASGQSDRRRIVPGAAELKDILAGTKRDDFVRCLPEKMLTYALGRGLEYYDCAATSTKWSNAEGRPAVFAPSCWKWSAVRPFQMQRATAIRWPPNK